MAKLGLSVFFTCILGTEPAETYKARGPHCIPCLRPLSTGSTGCWSEFTGPHFSRSKCLLLALADGCFWFSVSGSTQVGVSRAAPEHCVLSPAWKCSSSRALVEARVSGFETPSPEAAAYGPFARSPAGQTANRSDAS